MTKNPFLNALAALLYIVFVASIMFYGLKSLEHKDSIIIPISIISLFTLSAAVMGYIFLCQPFQLLFAGKNKDAANLFLQTIGAFAGITFIIFFILFSKII